MSSDPTREPGRELALPPRADLDAGPIDPATIDRQLAGPAGAVTVARVNRLGLSVRALGLASIGLAVGSATFVWPSVRLRGLLPTVGLAVACALAGLAVRRVHRHQRRRLAPDPRRKHPVLRSKGHRCHVGLALAALMLASGVSIRLAQSSSDRRPDGGEATAPLRPDVATGFARLRAEARPPGSAHLEGDLALAVASVELRRQGLDGPVLVVRLEARNRSDGRKLDLDAGRDVEGPLARSSLHDNLGNGYSARRRPVLESRPDPAAARSLYPGESAVALLTFERPVPAASTLLLRVPAGTFTLDAPVSFAIDAGALEPPGSGD